MKAAVGLKEGVGEEEAEMITEMDTDSSNQRLQHLNKTWS